MSRDIGLTLDGAGGQTADEEFSCKQINEQGRQGCNQRGRHVDVVFLHTVCRIDYVVQCSHDRLPSDLAESESKDEIIVDACEYEDHCNHDD